MDLSVFTNRFPNENACILFLRQQREKNGIICRKCKCHKHYFLEKQLFWKCAKCHTSTSLTGQIIMKKSKVPLLEWFACMYLATTTDERISALEIQMLFRFGSYETAWSLMKKVREQISKFSIPKQLPEIAEINPLFFA